MEVRLRGFIDNLKNDIDRNRLLSGEGSRKSFVECFSELIPDEEAPNIQLVYLDEKFGSKKVAVDGYVYNSEERTLVLVIADWNDFSEEANLTKAQADRYFKLLRNFFTLSLEEKLQDPVNGLLEWSSPEHQLASTIATEPIDRIRLLLFTDRNLSEQFKTVSNEPINDIPVSEEVWDCEKIYLHLSSGADHVPLEINFEDYPIPLTKAAEGHGFTSYLGVIAAEKLAQIYREYGGRLLEGNVRSYLTLKSSVNKDIRGSILRDPKRFFIYNNGIAGTGRDLVFDDDNRLIRVTDFQIINGGQTTASLARAAHADKADLSDIQVAIKLTCINDELEPDKARELIRNISRFSNNQNKVSGADFSSNHEFHVVMEQYSQRISAPPAPGKLHGTYWFYERNRGSYEQTQMFMTKGEKNAFTMKSDKKHLVKKEDLARVRLAWEGMPDIVSKGANHLFSYFMNQLDEDWVEKRKAGYYGENYFKDSIALLIMYNQMRVVIKDADWYDKGYLANIVAYGIAVLSMLFKKQFPKREFNFNLIWAKQTLPQPLETILLEICKDVKSCLTSSDRQKENVTEWAKMSQCWKRIREHFNSMQFRLPDYAESWCKPEEEVKEEHKQAKENAKIDGGVELLSQVLQYQQWEEARIFAKNKSCLTPLQTNAVRKCTMIPNRVPTEKEALHALEALAILRQEGYQG